ncbi:MAG: response regulator [Betaproteobacteria bacterium]|nr:response regulator [Betaproteobacteria bacterium]
MLKDHSTRHTTPTPVSIDHRILLIEDDVELARLTADYLSKHDVVVNIEHRGDRALARIAVDHPDLIVLDVMLPGKDGFSICRELRASGNQTPIIMLTAREEDFDQVLGLELGADDYLTKPVEPRLLYAHIKAILRRIASPEKLPVQNSERLQFGRLSIHHTSREVRLGDVPMELTTAEFDLLWMLASNAGRVLSRNEILKDLRGLEYDGIDRSIDSRISRLRRKLGDDSAHATHIKTIRPHGYLFSPADW